MQLALYGLLYKDNLLGINSPLGSVWKQGLHIKIGGLYRGSSYQREADSSVNLPCIETVAGESCPLFIQLRHRAPSSPIYLSEVIRFSLRLIASIPLIQRREKHRSREEKSAFP